MRRNSFKPTTPPDAATHIAAASRAHRVLCVSEFKALDRFYYTRSDGSEGVVHASFLVNGAQFSRRVRECAVGNFGVQWVRVLGNDYQLSHIDR